MATGAVVARVRVEVARAAPGVTGAGEKEQVVSAGKPEQESETAALKAPLSGVTVTV